MGGNDEVLASFVFQEAAGLVRQLGIHPLLVDGRTVHLDKAAIDKHQSVKAWFEYLGRQKQVRATAGQKQLVPQALHAPELAEHSWRDASVVVIAVDERAIDIKE